MGGTMPLRTVELKPRVGSELKTDLDTLLSGSVAAEIRALLVQRGVLIARDIHMDDAQQRQFTRTLGDLRLGIVKQEGDEGLMKVTLDKKENPTYAEFFPGTFFWHIDGTYEEIPPFATVLTPRVLAPSGGQTEFANNYAAYADLPASEQAFLDKLQVVHTMQASILPAIPDATVEQFALWHSYPVRTHPLVWRHKSGRKSLFLSTSASHIVGMHPAESHAVLQRLKNWATQPQYVYQHRWQMNDLLIWDNTGTMHRVLPFDVNCGRLLHRFTLNGEEAVMSV
jgi:alpha-ketoglutarate-dependent taurine dioxygenase